MLKLISMQLMIMAAPFLAAGNSSHALSSEIPICKIQETTDEKNYLVQAAPFLAAANSSHALSTEIPIIKIQETTDEKIWHTFMAYLFISAIAIIFFSLRHKPADIELESLLDNQPKPATREQHRNIGQHRRSHLRTQGRQEISFSFRPLDVDEVDDGSDFNFFNDFSMLGSHIHITTKRAGRVFLEMAALRDRADHVKRLLDAGVDPNGQDIEGRTPLHTAVAADSQGAFQILVRNSATNLNAMMHDGTTPLMLAAELEREGMVETLINSGADDYDELWNPEMAEFTKRLSTFNGWPLNFLLPKKLAKYGFYYSGVDDQVTCYCCGGSIRNWRLKDDPYFEHKKFFPSCDHLHLMRESGQIPFNPKSEGFYLNHIIRQACEIIPKDVVEKATLMSEKIDRSSTLDELMDELLKFDKKENPSPHSDALLCKICWDNEMCMVFQPCGHFATCFTCSEQVYKCPICTKLIKSKIRTYIS